MAQIARRRPSQKEKVKYLPYDYARVTEDDPLSRNDERTEFERDRSRIIHSAAFRRLQGKTQVYVTGEGDFVRTRLTHSLEVAQIGKGIALRLRADPDLVESISLLHDIGHPPFGHAGEIELKRLMKPYGGFEANAQNLRIIRELEAKSENYHGLNLTRAVVDGQLKYKVTIEEDADKFIYRDDLDLVDWACSEAIIASGVKGIQPKSFECQIMDWADEVAYAVHDLEDSLHTEFIDMGTLDDETALDETNMCKLKNKFKNEAVNVDCIYGEFLSELRYSLFGHSPTRTRRDHHLQRAGRKRLTSFLINRYIKGTGRIDLKEPIESPVSYRYLYCLDVPIEFRVQVAIINKIIRKHVIQSPQIASLEEKGKHIIRCLFVKFMRGDNAFKLLPIDWQSRLSEQKRESDRRHNARVICDYISGMTDDYAQRIFAKLFLPNYGSIHERL